VSAFINEESSMMADEADRYCVYSTDNYGYEQRDCIEKMFTRTFEQVEENGKSGIKFSDSGNVFAKAEDITLDEIAATIVSDPGTDQPKNGWSIFFRTLPGAPNVLRLKATESNLFVSTTRRLSSMDLSGNPTPLINNPYRVSFNIQEFALSGVPVDRILAVTAASGYTMRLVDIKYKDGSWRDAEISTPFEDLTSTFATEAAIYVGSTTNGLGISYDGGKTFSVKTMNDGLASPKVNSIVGNSSKIFVGTDAGISISADNGTSFINRTVTNGLGGDSIDRLLFVDNKLYAVSGKNLSISGDEGSTFTNAVLPDAISDLAVQGSNIFVVVGGKVLRSIDGANAFSEIPFDNGAATFVAAMSTKCFVSSSKGVFVLPL
jgi:hypothetical protein